MSGFEAKTREAQAVVDEAKATAASLRELAVATASLEVDMLAAAGNIWVATPAARKDQLKAQLLERLKALGLSDEQLATVDSADREWVMRDYVIALLQPINTNTDPAKSAAYEKAFESELALTPDECAKILERFHIDDEKTKELLTDYRYYYETGKQRRPDVWHRRG
jgi:hypothetical protein